MVQFCCTMNKISFRTLPLLLPAISMLAGVIWNEFGTVPQGLILAFGTILFLGQLIIRKPWHSSGTDLLQGVAVACIFLAFGAMMHDLRNRRPAGNFSELESGKVSVRGTVLRSPVLVEKGWKTHLEVDSVMIAGDWYATEGRVFLRSRDSIHMPENTMRIEATGYIHPIADTAEAGFLTYCRRNGYSHSMYALTVSPIGYDQGLMAVFSRIQFLFSNRVHQMIEDPAISGLVNAMMLGDTRGITDDIRLDFSQTGLSHILAISGAHVALIYALLSRILAFLFPGSRFSRLKLVILLGVLMVYGAVSGGSPAVSRACIMIACYIVARMFWQRTYAANLLAAGLIGQILWDPNMVFNIGFQLSYAAVSGILMLASPIQDRIAKMYPGIPAYFPETLGMTLAAQLLTTPLILFHFGQFPAWFLLANLVVIPVGNLVVYLGFAFLGLMWVPGVAGMVAEGVTWVVRLMCLLTELIGSLPWAVIQHRADLTGGVLVILFQMGMVWALFVAYRRLRNRTPRFRMPQWSPLPIFTHS